MPYICLSQDLPDGTVQVLDLKPNTSQRSLTYEPPGQTQYVNRVQNNTVVPDAVGVTMAATVGLRAYLVDRVEPDGGSWTAADQATVSDALVARLDAGLALTLADIDTVIQATFGGSDLDGAGSDSTGTVEDVLSILAGREYVLGAGFTKGDGGVWDTTQRGSFTDSVIHNDPDLDGPIGGVATDVERKPIVTTVHSSALSISMAVGHLATLTSGVTLFPDNSEFSAFKGQQFQQPGPQTAQVDGARVVTVYDDDGSVLA